MADKGGAGGGGTSFIPHISRIFCNCVILKYWQGTVEIAIRFGCILLAFCAFIAACVAVGELGEGEEGEGSDIEDDRDSASGAAGWLIFVAIIAVATEGVVILLRFLNLRFINQFMTIFLIANIITSVVLVIFFLTAGASISKYAEDWRKIADDFDDIDRYKRAATALGASAAFAFIAMVAFILLTLWISLVLIFKWGASISSPSGAV